MSTMALLFSLAVRIKDAKGYSCPVRCYSSARFYGGGTQLAAGASDYIDVGCDAVEEEFFNHMSDEMWAIMYEPAHEESWIEAGIETGHAYDGGQFLFPGFFVAWQRTTAATYEETDTGVIAEPVWNNIQLWQDKPGKSKVWHAFTAGTGTLTSPPFSNEDAAIELQTGLETTTPNGWNDASATNLEWEKWNGGWQPDWEYNPHYAELRSGRYGETVLGQTGPFYNGWYKKDWSFKFGMNFHGC
jgi:hypothetical protein